MAEFILAPSSPPETEHSFHDENGLTALQKGQLLNDWTRFIYSGFKKLLFTPELHRFLIAECAFTARYSPNYFWAYYFNSEILRLRAFLNQFGGNGQSADFGTIAWLGGPATDLKGAMCREMSLIYEPICQVLADLEFKHAELGRLWREFALAANLADPGFPAHYLVSENSRNLLAYAATIAVSRRHPLLGLQPYFPMPLLPESLPVA
jgi:hypothetical protein